MEGHRHHTSPRRRRQLTQGNRHRGRKARKRRGRGLSLPLVLLFSLQQKLGHILANPIAAIINPIMAFLTAIIIPARFAMTGNTQAMVIVLLGRQETVAHLALHTRTLMQRRHHHAKETNTQIIVNRKNLVTLVHSLIVLKVDYCNSLFIGLPNVILKRVQSVLNRAIRLIFNRPLGFQPPPHLLSCIGRLLGKN